MQEQVEDLEPAYAYDASLRWKSVPGQDDSEKDRVTPRTMTSALSRLTDRHVRPIAFEVPLRNSV